MYINTLLVQSEVKKEKMKSEISQFWQKSWLMINECIFLFLTQYLISVIHGLYDAGIGGDALSLEKRGSVELSPHLDFSVCPVDASSEPFKTTSLLL